MMERTFLPTFILGGAAKAGTTTAWEYLNSHPQICMALIKEPGFFTNARGCGNRPDPLAPRFSGRYRKGWSWYTRLFKDCQRARAIGEASVTYMPEADAPALIHRHLPHVQMLFLVRDPVDRLYSHFWQEVRHGWTLPKFYEMVSQRHPTLLRYIYVSSYHLHIRRYLEYFPARQVQILFFDDLVYDPAVFIQQLYRLIGVDDQYIPTNLGQKYNSRQIPVISRWKWLNRWLATNLIQLTRHKRLADWIKAQVWPVVQGNQSQGVDSPLDPDLRARLLPEFNQTISFLENHCQRDLSLWRQGG